MIYVLNVDGELDRWSIAFLGPEREGMSEWIQKELAAERERRELQSRQWEAERAADCPRPCFDQERTSAAKKSELQRVHELRLLEWEASHPKPSRGLNPKRFIRKLLRDHGYLPTDGVQIVDVWIED